MFTGTPAQLQEREQRARQIAQQVASAIGEKDRDQRMAAIRAAGLIPHARKA